jgi:hypothetical protein
MHPCIRLVALCGLWSALLLVVGCGNSIRLVPVEGVVKINGKPAADIHVQFMPDSLKNNKGPTSFGTTNAEGKFTLMAQDGRMGAVVGPHQVTLTDNLEDRPQQGKPAKNPASRLDPKYVNPLYSGLTLEVKEGGPPLEINAVGPVFRR